EHKGSHLDQREHHQAIGVTLEMLKKRRHHLVMFLPFWVLFWIRSEILLQGEAVGAGTNQLESHCCLTLSGGKLTIRNVTTTQFRLSSCSECTCDAPCRP